jgi:hypothetical protein
MAQRCHSDAGRRATTLSALNIHLADEERGWTCFLS